MKINIKFDTERATKKFKERFEQLKRDPAWKEQAAELAIRKIVGDTRMGNFIADGSKQKQLSDEWIERRNELSKYNATGTSFSNKKSNLTFSGQLLQSLSRTDHPTQVIIEPKGDRTPYKNKSGKSTKATITNEDLAKALKAKGRKFLGYDDKLVKQVKKMLKEHVRRFLV